MIKLYIFSTDYHKSLLKHGEKVIIYGAYHHQNIQIKLGKDVWYYETWYGKYYPR